LRKRNSAPARTPHRQTKRTTADDRKSQSAVVMWSRARSYGQRYETFNIQHPTPNIQHPISSQTEAQWMFDVGCWLLDVFHRFTFNSETSNVTPADSAFQAAWAAEHLPFQHGPRDQHARRQ